MRKDIDLLAPLVFLYFVTLHADQLGFTLCGLNIRANNLIALLLITLLCIRFRNSLFVIDRELLFALSLISLSIVISCLFSPFKSRCVIFLVWFFMTLVCYAFLPYLLAKIGDLHHLFSLYCASYVAVGLYALCQLLFSFLGLHDPFALQQIREGLVRPNAWAYEPSFYALYMTPFIMMCNLHYLAAPGTPFFCFKRLNFSKIAFLNVLFLVSTSTSAVFAYLVCFVFLVCFPPFKSFRKKSLYFISSFVMLTALFGLCFPHILKGFFLKFFFHGFMSHGSFYERWAGIHNAWKVFVQYPFFGVGLGGYPPLLHQAWVSGDSSYIYFGKQLLERAQESNLYKAFEPMNVFTEVLASLGVVGVAAFGYLFIILIKKTKQAFSEASLMVSNLFFSILIMLIVLQINQGLLRTYVWVHFSLVFAFFEVQIKVLKLNKPSSIT